MKPWIPLLGGWLALMPLAAPVLAHEGHDHAEPPPVLPDWAPRATARSELFDLVLALAPATPDSPPRLRLWLSGADNSPLADARIQLALNPGQPDAWQAEARAVGEGAYQVDAPALARPGSYALTASVERGEDMDLLPLQLVVPAPAATAAGGAPDMGWRAGLGLAALALGAGVVWQQRRRAG